MLNSENMRKNLHKLWTALTLLLLVGPMASAMVVQNISITGIEPMDPAAVDSVVLEQSHSVALGTAGQPPLESVAISITATLQATVQVENTDMAPPQPVTFTFQYSPTIDVDINGGPNLLTGINPSATSTFNAGPPDGTIDFGGSAGTTQNLNGMDSDSIFLTSASGAAFTAFDGSGTVQLDFSTLLQDLSTTPFILTDPTGKPITVGLNTHSVDITGTVTYTFAPEPGTMILMVSVFGMAHVLRARRRRQV